MISLKELLFFVVVLLSNIIQCITGFAGTVLAMPFSIMLVGFETAKPILNILGIVASIGVVWVNHKSLNKKEFLKMIGIMLIGMLLGFAIANTVSLNSGMLYKILGAVVIAFVFIGVYNGLINKKRNEAEMTKTNPLIYTVLIISGLVHGMFVCGGPLLVVYANKKMKDKDEFRVTVSAVWIVLNSIIMFSDIKDGYFNSRLIMLLAISVVILLLSIFIGNAIFRHMNKKAFMIITYVLMAISGLSLLLK